MRRLLLLVPKRTYRLDDFLTAADRMDGIDVVIGSDRCRTLEKLGATPHTRPSMVLDFSDVERTVRRIQAAGPFDAIVATDDAPVVVATRAAEALGLPHNAEEAVLATRDKLRMRECLARGGISQPLFESIRSPRTEIPFPCVLKPRALNASRGVIRVDDEYELRAAFTRISRLLDDPYVRKKSGDALTILAESFVPGIEVALEGVLTRGKLDVIALFDKPDPLDGPYFEETIYVTPSRLPAPAQQAIAQMTSAAAAALGLRHGPIHAELRICAGQPYVIDIAGRTIGGLCGRMLRFGAGVSLEELVIRHALGEAVHHEHRGAAGVLMIPIPRSGVLRRVEGVERARAIEGIEDVAITAEFGRLIHALPDGDAYLGFAFARADDPAKVEAALRKAQSELRVEVDPVLPVL